MDGWMVSYTQIIRTYVYTPPFSLRSYDMVHFGHANACRQAKLMGTHLVVGVHSDGKTEIICLFVRFILSNFKL